MRQLDRAKEEVRRAESRAAKLQERLQDAEHHAGQVWFCVNSEPVHAEASMSCCIKPLLACYLGAVKHRPHWMGPSDGHGPPRLSLCRPGLR